MFIPCHHIQHSFDPSALICIPLPWNRDSHIESKGTEPCVCSDVVSPQKPALKALKMHIKYPRQKGFFTWEELG